MKKLYSLLLTFTIASMALGQDTFSIVAVDPETGEVGSAGASCVDLFNTPFSDDSFLGKLFPGFGAMNSQAYYIPANQTNGTNQMLDGSTPQEVIDYVVANDVQGTPEFRQYGVASIIDGMPQSAGYTGESTDDFKGHVLGPNYAIQGNILLGQVVLDSMEARFLAEEGDLACKLMAALQGANMVGADTRCEDNGTSSLFAFVKVAQPDDVFGDPSFMLSVRTHDGNGIEPIDSLQVLFNQAGLCGAVNIEDENMEELASIFPNPASQKVTIRPENPALPLEVKVTSASGQQMFQGEIAGKIDIQVNEWPAGMYIVHMTQGDLIKTRRLVVE